MCLVTREGHTAVVELLIAAGAATDTTSKVEIRSHFVAQNILFFNQYLMIAVSCISDCISLVVYSIAWSDSTSLECK